MRGDRPVGGICRRIFYFWSDRVVCFFFSKLLSRSWRQDFSNWKGKWRLYSQFCVQWFRIILPIPATWYSCYSSGRESLAQCRFRMLDLLYPIYFQRIQWHHHNASADMHFNWYWLWYVAYWLILALVCHSETSQGNKEIYGSSISFSGIWTTSWIDMMSTRSVHLNSR